MPTQDELVACARRVAAGAWTVGPEGGAEVQTNAALAEMVGRGFVRLHYTAAYRLTDDFWVLTPEGAAWLDTQ